MLPTEQKVLPTRPKVLDTTTVFFLLVSLSFLYCFLFIPPFLPIEVNNLGDCFLYLAPGQRMYQGDMIYRDVFEFVPPGTALVNLFMFKLFGLRLWIPDLLALLLGLGLVWLGVVIARKLMRPSLALLSSAIFLVAVRTFLYDPTHHWYSLLAAIAAIAVLLERRTPARIAAAGFFCSVSACFTQTRGLAAVVGFALFLWWESRRRQEGWRSLLKKETWLLTSFLTTFLAVNAYFIWKAGPAGFLWCTVVFVLKYYPKEADWNTFQVVKEFFPAAASVQSFYRSLAGWLVVAGWLFLYTVPLIFILFFARYWRESHKKPLEYWERPMLVAIVGFFMLLSIVPSPSPNRLAVSALPALILLGWFLDSPRKLARTLVVMFTVGVLLAAIHAVARRRPTSVGILATPQGKIALIAQGTYQEYIWIQQHTRPSEYFYEASFPDEYFHLDLRNPTPLSRVVNNGYTTPEQVEEVIRGLQQHPVRYIFWGPENLDVLPKWESPSDDHLGPLRDYIHSHYNRVKVFANSDEIWEKRTE